MKATRKKFLMAAGILILILVAYLKSCAYLPIEGTVIDAETKQPIEGAVVLAEWMITKGIGLSYTSSYKAVDTITDKAGKFNINAFVIRPFSDVRLTIYKTGFVCWNNKYIFPGYRQRDNFKWESNKKYELEKFKREYSYAEYVGFISSFVNPFLFPEKKKVIRDAYQWEVMMKQKELGGER